MDEPVGADLGRDGLQRVRGVQQPGRGVETGLVGGHHEEVAQVVEVRVQEDDAGPETGQRSPEPAHVTAGEHGQVEPHRVPRDVAHRWEVGLDALLVGEEADGAHAAGQPVQLAHRAEGIAQVDGRDREHRRVVECQHLVVAGAEIEPGRAQAHHGAGTGAVLLQRGEHGARIAGRAVPVGVGADQHVDVECHLQVAEEPPRVEGMVRHMDHHATSR